MNSNSKSQQNITQSIEHNVYEEGQAITQEQLSDVYFAGTSNGVIQLEQKTITVPNTGYEEDQRN